MDRYHISNDGAPRVCNAQTAESCTAVGVDGDSAPHGDFNTPEEARRFAESVLEKSLGDGLSSIGRLAENGEKKAWNHPDYDEFNGLIGLDTSAEREVIEEFPNPNAERDAERDTIRSFWKDNGVANQFAAMEEAATILKEEASASTVTDRPAFSTDMTDSTEYRVEGGRLKAEFEGESYDLGGLREVSKDLVDEWSGEMLQEDANFQDGEVFPIYTDEGNEAGAYARFGEKYYLAGLGNDWVSLTP